MGDAKLPDEIEEAVADIVSRYGPESGLSPSEAALREVRLKETVATLLSRLVSERDEARKERDAANARFTKRIGDLTAEHLAIIDAEIAKADEARKERDRAVDALVETLVEHGRVDLGEHYAVREWSDAFAACVYLIDNHSTYESARDAVAALIKGAL